MLIPVGAPRVALEVEHRCDRCAKSSLVRANAWARTVRVAEERAALYARIMPCPRCARRNKDAYAFLWWAGGVALTPVALCVGLMVSSGISIGSSPANIAGAVILAYACAALVAAGGAVALAVAWRGLRRLSSSRLQTCALSAGPPAVLGPYRGVHGSRDAAQLAP